MVKSDEKDNVHLIFYGDPGGDLLGFFLRDEVVFYQIPEQIHDPTIVYIYISFCHAGTPFFFFCFDLTNIGTSSPISFEQPIWLTGKDMEVPIVSEIKNFVLISVAACI